MDGVKYDNLIGGSLARSELRNVLIDSDTTVERGMLLAGEGFGSDLTVHIATAADANGELFIAARDDASVPVTTVYTRGSFNRSAVKVSEGVSLEAFESGLRRQNIELREMI